jgi:ribose 5-phosphate isomerase A
MRSPLPSERDLLKRAAAARAVTEVEDEMVVRLASGSTAAFAVETLAVRTAKDLCDAAASVATRAAAQ